RYCMLMYGSQSTGLTSTCSANLVPDSSSLSGLLCSLSGIQRSPAFLLGSSIIIGVTQLILRSWEARPMVGFIARYECTVCTNPLIAGLDTFARDEKGGR